MTANSSPAVRVGIVIACWEDYENTERCLNSLLGLTGLEEAGIEVSIVLSDDASSIAITTRLEELVESHRGEPVQLKQAERRGGFGATINRGITALADFGADYFWLLNNDIRVDEDALLALVNCAGEMPQVDVWGCTVMSGLQGDRLECAAGYRYSRLSTRGHGLHAEAPLDAVATLPEVSPDYISGAATFCSASLIEALGGLSEDYFLYFEELDLIRRADRPLALGWCRLSRVYHGSGLSTGTPGLQRSALQQYYENYSTLLYTRRYDPLLLPWVLLSRCLLKPLLFVRRREWHLYRPFTLAVLDFLRGASPRRFS